MVNFCLPSITCADTIIHCHQKTIIEDQWKQERGQDPHIQEENWKNKTFCHSQSARGKVQEDDCKESIQLAHYFHIQEMKNLFNKCNNTKMIPC
jgi:hypothetical protein